MMKPEKQSVVLSEKDHRADEAQLQRISWELAKTFGWATLPKGAFKFRTHEEADAWLLKYEVRKRSS